MKSTWIEEKHLERYAMTFQVDEEHAGFPGVSIDKLRDHPIAWKYRDLSFGAFLFLQTEAQELPIKLISRLGAGYSRHCLGNR